MITKKYMYFIFDVCRPLSLLPCVLDGVHVRGEGICVYCFIPEIVVPNLIVISATIGSLVVYHDYSLTS